MRVQHYIFTEYDILQHSGHIVQDTVGRPATRLVPRRRGIGGGHTLTQLTTRVMTLWTARPTARRVARGPRRGPEIHSDTAYTSCRYTEVGQALLRVECQEGGFRDGTVCTTYCDTLDDSTVRLPTRCPVSGMQPGRRAPPRRCTSCCAGSHCLY